MIKVIPSILTKSNKELEELIDKSNRVVDRVSIDIIDGKFADNKTITPDALSNIEINFKIDYQLMVVEPVNWIDRCVEGKASKIIGHIEHMSNQSDFIEKVLEQDIKPGLGLDLKTPIDNIDVSILHNIDTVLLMSVPAGFGGQEFDESVFGKISELNDIKISQNLNFNIHIDGGVMPHHIRKLEELGATEVSIGRRFFEGDLQANINEFKSYG